MISDQKSSNNSQQIFVHHVGVAEDVLGPGKRLVIWTSGCPMNCPGCIEPGLHNIEAGIPWGVGNFYHKIKPSLVQLKKVTISGGEPFYQPLALSGLLNLLNHDCEVMIFSGYKWNYLNSQFIDILPYVDILVAGEYDQGKQGSYLWRGSCNQQIISPSNKYSHETINFWMNAPSAGIQVVFEDDNMFVYGVPAKGVLDDLYISLHNKKISTS
ncbi:MAG: 4Fe-4S single cluster domain-containing protein [Candidatus Cloacimonas sp.]|jgi:anaerobic ribonucleoside-triphosphate reductase activating protein|nr:4Fe-4S single cluster domain-containing protein [Candidatus Cloacimonas sp.]